MRRAGGVYLWGDVGEVWRGEQKLGVLFRWHLEGWEREWRLEAERYRLDAAADGVRNVRLLLDAKVGTLDAEGSIWTDFKADGEGHRAIVIRGGALSFQRAVPAKENNDARNETAACRT